MGHIILTSVQLAEADRPNAPEDEADLGSSPIIDQASVMHEAQFGLSLS